MQSRNSSHQSLKLRMKVTKRKKLYQKKNHKSQSKELLEQKQKKSKKLKLQNLKERRARQWMKKT
jgi:UDP-galactopyranose mutase